MTREQGRRLTLPCSSVRSRPARYWADLGSLAHAVRARAGARCGSPRHSAAQGRASGSVGCSRRDGLIGACFVVVGEPRIPTLEQGAKRSVQGAGARLQQEVGAAFGPLHLLTLGETLADDGVYRGLGQT